MIHGIGIGAIDTALIAAFTASGAVPTATPVDPTREEVAGLVKVRRLLADSEVICAAL